MSGYKTASGLLDYIGSEACYKKKIEDILINNFGLRGYSLIETPTIEYYAMFNGDQSIIDSNKLFKLIDGDGSIIALRPDMTSGISRVVSTKLEEKKITRLMYRGRAFNFDNKVNELREFTQAGIEVFGLGDYRIDAEVIRLCIESIFLLGIRDFVIEIGNVEYINAFLGELDITQHDKLLLKEVLQKKDVTSIENICRNLNFSEKEKDFILSAITMFGDNSIFKIAREKAINEKAKEAVDRLELLYQYFDKLGLSKYIAFDFGLVSTFDYYTGVIFKGMTKDYGTSFLSGGRYDNLCKNAFGNKINAFGAAFGIDRLLVLLSKLNKLPNAEQVDIAIGYDEEMKDESFKLMNEIINKTAKSVFDTYITDLEDFKKQAKSLVNAEEYIFLTKDNNVITVKE